MTVPTAGAGSIADLWHELVTASLLGTDRRQPPQPPAGPVADVVDDAVRDTPSGRMLAAVAATVIAKRAGLRPHPPAPALSAPPRDDRPMLPVSAARRWHELVAHWPVLEDEWLAVADSSGWRPSPDVAVGLLRRHRQDASRRACACRFIGPLADWLVGHQRQLAPPHNHRVSTPFAGAPPDLPMPPELQALLASEADEVVQAVAGGFRAGAYALAHRGVLVNFVARVRPDVLVPLAAAFRDLPAGIAVAHALVEQAAARHAMLEELRP